MKQLLGPKLALTRARGASRNILDPYLFLQPLKLSTSKLVYNLAFGSIACRETTFTTKIGGGPG